MNIKRTIEFELELQDDKSRLKSLEREVLDLIKSRLSQQE